MFGWRYTRAGGTPSYVHPTAGYVHRNAEGRWEATRANGFRDPRTYKHPKHARRALGSDE